MQASKQTSLHSPSTLHAARRAERGGLPAPLAVGPSRRRGKGKESCDAVHAREKQIAHAWSFQATGIWSIGAIEPALVEQFVEAYRLRSFVGLTWGTPRFSS